MLHQLHHIRRRLCLRWHDILYENEDENQEIFWRSSPPPENKYKKAKRKNWSIPEKRLYSTGNKIFSEAQDEFPLKKKDETLN